MILAGDIGGTKTNLAFLEVQGRELRPVVEETLASREHSSLDDTVRHFVSAHALPIDSACFGVAGPFKHGRCEAVNLPWVVDARQLASHLGLATVTLLNDLEVNVYGIAALAPEDFVVLNAGAPDAAGSAEMTFGAGKGQGASP